MKIERIRSFCLLIQPSYPAEMLGRSAFPKGTCWGIPSLPCHFASWNPYWEFSASHGPYSGAARSTHGFLWSHSYSWRLMQAHCRSRWQVQTASFDDDSENAAPLHCSFYTASVAVALSGLCRYPLYLFPLCMFERWCWIRGWYLQLIGLSGESLGSFVELWNDSSWFAECEVFVYWRLMSPLWSWSHSDGTC